MIQMTSNTTPYDVFPFGIASRVKDTGDCWLWEGPVDKKTGAPVFYERVGKKRCRSYVASLAYRLCNDIVPPHSIKTLPACEDRKCVHPEHLALVSDVVGTMFRIKEKTVSCGDCLVWTGEVSGRNNSPRIHRQVGSTFEGVPVRTFVYAVEHGIPYAKNMDLRVRTTCDTPKCVSHRHLKAVGSDGYRPCAKGLHVIPPGDKQCKPCREATLHYDYAVRCSRGHTTEEVEHRGIEVCDACNREDAAQYLKDTAQDFLARWA